MSRIIVELGDGWARKRMERNDADALDLGSLLETSRALEIRELVRVFNRYGNPGSRSLSQRRSIWEQSPSKRPLRARSLPPVEGLAGLFAVDAGELEPEERANLLAELRSLHSIVESAAFEPSYRGTGTAPPAATPLYRRDQRYLDAIGLDDIPNNGQWFGIGFADVDVGWNLDHEALRHIGRPPLFPRTLSEVPADAHGTAVLGVVVGGAKIQGIAEGATVKALVFPTRGPTTIAEQLLEFIDEKPNNPLQYGDILLIEIEQEAAHGAPEGLPLEVQPAVFRVIQLAVSRGIVVIEAAGNGAKQGSVRVGWDLDEIARDGRHAPAWRQKSGGNGAIPRSGAIMVSGCQPSRQGDAEPYTVDPRLNHGSMVGCYGFGSTVVTSGGNFPPPGHDLSPNRDDPNVWYDCGFGMTSAAAAMVTGAALAIQRMAHEELGHALSPSQLQAVLGDPNGGASVQRNGRRTGIVPHLPKVRNLLRKWGEGHA